MRQDFNIMLALLIIHHAGPYTVIYPIHTHSCRYLVQVLLWFVSTRMINQFLYYNMF